MPGPIGLGALPPARKGDFIITSSGTHFWPLDPRPDEVHIEDIAHALSQQVRWAGHAPVRYSTAQHSLYVSARARQLAEAYNARLKLTAETAARSGVHHDELDVEKIALCGRLHDAGETYFADVPSPVKKFILDYYKIEAGILRAVGHKFNCVLEPMNQIVAQADRDVLVTEASVFFPEETWWRNYGGEVLTPLPFVGVEHCMYLEPPWRRVRDLFLEGFHESNAALARAATRTESK